MEWNEKNNNFPAKSGTVDECGFDEGEGFTINVPLPAGSGSAAYSKVMSDIVVPAFDAFKPDLVRGIVRGKKQSVSCGM